LEVHSGENGTLIVVSLKNTISFHTHGNWFGRD
jgi:hypothetical protein